MSELQRCKVDCVHCGVTLAKGAEIELGMRQNAPDPVTGRTACYPRSCRSSRTAHKAAARARHREARDTAEATLPAPPVPSDPLKREREAELVTASGAQRYCTRWGRAIEGRTRESVPAAASGARSAEYHHPWCVYSPAVDVRRRTRAPHGRR
ncbi:hypothetical protein [Streptomyces sp. CC53]|uniref:hypothetical protein n=1 Tax=Streptomyces sp. CC53 TaxID=1906740 RepID=UPI00115F9014|nr:hypothetical protein [Streptomyces sp. CC53]